MANEHTKPKPRPHAVITLIVEREFLGGKSVAEALAPVILEDLRRKAESGGTFDKQPGSS